MTFGAIISWILWRFRPVLWLDGVRHPRATALSTALVVVVVVVVSFFSSAGFSAQRIHAPPFRRTPEIRCRHLS